MQQPTFVRATPAWDFAADLQQATMGLESALNRSEASVLREHEYRLGHLLDQLEEIYGEASQIADAEQARLAAEVPA